MKRTYHSKNISLNYRDVFYLKITGYKIWENKRDAYCSFLPWQNWVSQQKPRGLHWSCNPLHHQDWSHLHTAKEQGKTKPRSISLFQQPQKEPIKNKEKYNIYCTPWNLKQNREKKSLKSILIILKKQNNTCFALYKQTKPNLKVIKKLSYSKDIEALLWSSFL